MHDIFTIFKKRHLQLSIHKEHRAQGVDISFVLDEEIIDVLSHAALKVMIVRGNLFVVHPVGRQ